MKGTLPLLFSCIFLSLITMSKTVNYKRHKKCFINRIIFFLPHLQEHFSSLGTILMLGNRKKKLHCVLKLIMGIYHVDIIVTVMARTYVTGLVITEANHLDTTCTSTLDLCKPHTTHNSSIRSDEGLTLETSAFEFL